MKVKLFLQAITLFAVIFLIGCSKDEDKTPSNGTIDVAVGTYKGTIDIIGGTKKFDEILVVSKLSATRIRVKVQNSSLNLADRDIDVMNNSNISIQALATEPQGLFIYTLQNKSLNFLSKQTAEGQLQYSFEGVKQ